MLLDGNQLNKSVPIPLYFQLKELILSEIKQGNYKKGNLIPTEKEFSEAYDISRTTVRQAITELVQEGWLYRVKSKGTYVSQPKISQDFIKKLETFQEQMERTGHIPSTELLEFKTVKADDIVAKNLQLPEKSKVIYLYRKRLADGEPIVTIQTYLPFERCEFIMTHNFAKESLYETLAQSDETKIFRVNRFVEAVEANTSDANLLNIKRGKPIQHFISIGYNAYDVPIEFSLARYRGDRSRFEVTVFTNN